MVLHHGRDPGVDHDGTPERSQAIAARAGALHQAKRARGDEQTAHARLGKIEAAGEVGLAPLAVAQGFEEPQPHASHEHLRIDETGAEVEERAGAAPRDGTRQREARGPGEKTGPEGGTVGQIVDAAGDRRPKPGRKTGRQPKRKRG